MASMVTGPQEAEKMTRFDCTSLLALMALLQCRRALVLLLFTFSFVAILIDWQSLAVEPLARVQVEGFVVFKSFSASPKTW